MLCQPTQLTGWDQPPLSYGSYGFALRCLRPDGFGESARGFA